MSCFASLHVSASSSELASHGHTSWVGAPNRSRMWTWTSKQSCLLLPHVLRVSIVMPRPQKIASFRIFGVGEFVESAISPFRDQAGVGSKSENRVSKILMIPIPLVSYFGWDTMICCSFSMFRCHLASFMSKTFAFHIETMREQHRAYQTWQKRGRKDGKWMRKVIVNKKPSIQTYDKTRKLGNSLTKRPKIYSWWANFKILP